MESQKSLDQGALAGAVRAQQADGAARKSAVEIFQNRAAVEENREVVEFYGWSHKYEGARSQIAHAFLNAQRHKESLGSLTASAGFLCVPFFGAVPHICKRESTSP